MLRIILCHNRSLINYMILKIYNNKMVYFYLIISQDNILKRLKIKLLNSIQIINLILATR